jgi:VanZ family protein
VHDHELAPAPVRRSHDHRLAQVIFVIAVAVHLAVLYWPRSPSTGGLPIDKVVHAVIFGMVLWAAARAGLPGRPVAVVLVVHAVVSELIQHFLLTGRSGDVTDSVADVAGVLIVTALLERRK